MAQDNTFIPFITPNVGAAMDLRAFQHRVVQMNAAGVRLAGTDISSGTPFVLANAPNSGQFVSLNQAPNVTKAWAASAVVRGDILTACASLATAPSSGGYVSVGSATSTGILGTALTAVASGSIVDMKLL